MQKQKVNKKSKHQAQNIDFKLNLNNLRMKINQGKNMNNVNY